MKIITYLLMLCLAVPLLSQELTVAGFIQNKEQKPVVANILLKQEGNIKYATTTDSLGYFIFKLTKGEYSLVVTLSEKIFTERKIQLQRDSLLPPIMIDDVSEMNVIEVQASKKLVEQKIDRLVFNVENSMHANGSDAFEVLKSTPGVQVRNESVAIVGKATMCVMVNDKIMQLSAAELTNYLKSIASENIQKIEIITTPPSKYDAEGNAGLINIVLKKVKEDNWNTSLRASYHQGIVGNLRSGINFSYKKNKFSALADLGYLDGHRKYENDIHFLYPKEYWKNRIDVTGKGKYWSSLLHINYDITDKSTIGLQFMGNFEDDISNALTTNRAYVYNNPTLIKEYITYQTAPEKVKNMALNAHFLQKIGTKGGKVSVDADYFQYNKNTDALLNSSFDNYQSNTHLKVLAKSFALQKIDNYSLKADVEFPAYWGNLSLGAKMAQTKTNNKAQSDFRDENNISVLAHDDLFLYTENTQALYADWAKSLGKKWSLKAGLRGENTQTKGISMSEKEPYLRHFFKLFPTLYVQYQVNDNHSLSASINRRIQRSYFDALNPGRTYISPKSYVMGNPFLQPSYTLGATLNYSYRHWLTAQLSYTQMQDLTSQTTYHNLSLEETKVLWENYANGYSWNLSINMNKNLFPWWEMAAYLSFAYKSIKPYIAIYPDDMNEWNGYQTLQNIFMLNKSKTLQATVSYEYKLPSDNGTNKTSATSSLDLGFKCLAFDKKLTIALNINDVFKTDIMTYTNQLKKQGVTESYRQYYDTQNIRLSLFYKFGNNKITVRKREGSNAEERSRS